MKKVYEIGFPANDEIDEGYIIWIATDRKITLRTESVGSYIKEIDVGITYPAGVDITVE